MSALPASSTVLSFEDARRVVEEQAALIQANNARPIATESVDLLAAAGRVLAEPVSADRDLPPFPRSTRDGYAVRSADLSQLPATLEMIGEIKAGEKLDRIPSAIASGQTVAIMTGAPVPAGPDAVVMVEYTSLRGKQVEITRSVKPGENIVPRGAEARAGAPLLDRGLRLNRGRHRSCSVRGKITLAGLHATACRGPDNRGRNRRHRRHSGPHADSQLEQLFPGSADSTSGR